MTGTAIRERSVVDNHSVGTFRTWSGTTLVSTSNPIVYDQFIQRTSSQGNPVGRVRNRRKVIAVYGYDPAGLQDIGGPFTTHKVTSRSYPSTVFDLQAGNIAGPHWDYRGRAVAWANEPSLTSAQYLTPTAINVLQAYGTTAIARCIPTNPLAGMGQFLGELRDLPKVPDIRAWKNRARNLRNGAKRVNFDKLSREAAGEYLNQVFGWAPFVSDLQKFGKVVKTAGPSMEKYARGANHPVHRKYFFPDETTTTTQVLGTASFPKPSLNSFLWTKGGTLTKTTITTTKRWFEGSFTYHLPPILPSDNGFVQAINKFRNAEAQVNKLFGLRLTPDLLYKLAPWSWAADWVTNAGDVVHNWSSFQNDGLVMNYGYLMEHRSVKETYSLVGVIPAGMPEQSFFQEITREVKTRIRATPYGFGVNPASFTAKQWSIIAALGISKQPLSLNF